MKCFTLHKKCSQSESLFLFKIQNLLFCILKNISWKNFYFQKKLTKLLSVSLFIYSPEKGILVSKMQKNKGYNALKKIKIFNILCYIRQNNIQMSTYFNNEARWVWPSLANLTFCRREFRALKKKLFKSRNALINLQLKQSLFWIIKPSSKIEKSGRPSDPRFAIKSLQKTSFFLMNQYLKSLILAKHNLLKKFILVKTKTDFLKKHLVLKNDLIKTKEFWFLKRNKQKKIQSFLHLINLNFILQSNLKNFYNYCYGNNHDLLSKTKNEKWAKKKSKYLSYKQKLLNSQFKKELFNFVIKRKSVTLLQEENQILMSSFFPKVLAKNQKQHNWTFNNDLFQFNSHFENQWSFKMQKKFYNIYWNVLNRTKRKDWSLIDCCQQCKALNSLLFSNSINLFRKKELNNQKKLKKNSIWFLKDHYTETFYYLNLLFHKNLRKSFLIIKQLQNSSFSKIQFQSTKLDKFYFLNDLNAKTFKQIFSQNEIFSTAIPGLSLARFTINSNFIRHTISIQKLNIINKNNKFFNQKNFSNYSFLVFNLFNFKFFNSSYLFSKTKTFNLYLRHIIEHVALG
eukprot:TRINITY_DN1440_c0_g4_i1.p1 TRINITY_DN1440_c0_g4~~TRINITY_DN1440_c0_g4_i1.p1  ORF type:complete len:569 (+),score=21.37 TRINITY_DN1440_c0_g4_i1:177-1883(+)